jgi:hypothetical protein
MLALFHPAVSALAFFQSTQLSLFERFLTQAVSGIDSTSITSGMQNVAYVVLVIGFLWQVYQSALHGGDVRGLGTNLIKYVATVVIVMNYHAVFTTINQGFVNAGNWVNSASGATNLLDNWGNDLKTQYSQVGFQNLWGLVTGSTAGVLDALLIIVAYILYPVVIAIFGFFYILYGSILYIFGPIVVALMPLGATNRLAKSYVENVFIWNAWPILYGGFGALLSAVQMGQVGQMLNQNDFLGGLGSLEGSILIGLASIIYSLAIAVIPFIAKKIVSGEVGATAGTLLGAAATALTMGVAASEGALAGAATSSSQAPTGSKLGTEGGSGMGTGSSSKASGNQPAPSQRVAPDTAISGVDNNDSGSSNAPPSTQREDRTEGERIADSIRGGMKSAIGSQESHKKDPATLDGMNQGEQKPEGADGITSSPQGQRPSKKSYPARRSGPSSQLMRPHGLATWGAYHAARLTTQGAAGGVRSAGAAVTSAAGSLANPVETAGKVGAKAGSIAGTAVNAAEKTAAVAGKVASAATHPGETVGAGVKAAGNAARTAASNAATAVQGSANAIKSSFANAYEKTRAGESNSEESA